MLNLDCQAIDKGLLLFYTCFLMVDDSFSPSQLQSLAIQKALESKWEEALELNQKLSDIEPENVDCLNRLARSYFELGNYSKAKKLYEQVLVLDPYNTIAQKNLKKVALFKKDGRLTNSNSFQVAISPSFFLEEPGLTKIVTLIKTAEPQKLLTLCSGQIVVIVPKNRSISVTDSNNTYLGAFPDDTAHHLLRLIAGGNKYQAFIKSVKSNGLTILVREVYRSKRFKNQASFLDESRILTYSSDHLPMLNDNIIEESDDDVTSSKEDNLDYKL